MLMVVAAMRVGRKRGRGGRRRGCDTAPLSSSSSSTAPRQCSVNGGGRAEKDGEEEGGGEDQVEGGATAWGVHAEVSFSCW